MTYEKNRKGKRRIRNAGGGEKYEAEITAELREVYVISKMVPLDNPRHPPPPGNFNVGFSAIKIEMLDAKNLDNYEKKWSNKKAS